MPAIWSNGQDGWELLAPEGFPDEATLHRMVEQSPQMLPLAGDPLLAVVGKEVQIGSGYVDLIALERSGRVAIIEVKLSRNAEARRAVIAQVLTYAAYLKGLDANTFQNVILQRHLSERGYSDLVDAINSGTQAEPVDTVSFNQGVADSLANGRFRIILVLDNAPAELARLVSYLENVTSDQLVIDLIAVSSYNVNGSQIVVPQRIQGDVTPKEAPPSAIPTNQGIFTPGIQEFVDSIGEAPEAEQSNLHRLCNWALSLEQEGLVSLGTFKGTSRRWTLLPRLKVDNVGLVTVWNEHGAAIQFWRSVFERRAPQSIPTIEAIIAPTHLGKGNTIRVIGDDLLSALTDAYREAAKSVQSI